MFAAVCVLVSPEILRSQTTVTLDKLSDCEGLQQTVAFLKKAPSRRCRNYEGPIEEKLITQYRTVPNMQSCILVDSPTQLSNFTCIRTSVNSLEELTCFRAISARALSDYVGRYDSVYSERVAQYEKLTKACSVGNGHFATVGTDLYPNSFVSIAKPRFGFVIGIDSSSRMHGHAYHGFADVDPDLTSSPKAIEIFDVSETDHIEQIVRDVSTEHASSFEIELENADASITPVAAWMRRQTGLPSFATARLISLKYTGKKDVDISERRENLDKWQDGMVAVLKDAGFREFNDEDGGTPDFGAMRELIIKNIPIAHRKFSADRLGAHIAGLTTDNRECLEFATVFVFYPVEDVKSDYGGVWVQLAGAGACRSERADSGILSEKRFDDVKEYLKGQL
jgi:hypothetical protein